MINVPHSAYLHTTKIYFSYCIFIFLCFIHLKVLYTFNEIVGVYVCGNYLWFVFKVHTIS